MKMFITTIIFYNQPIIDIDLVFKLSKNRNDEIAIKDRKATKFSVMLAWQLSFLQMIVIVFSMVQIFRVFSNIIFDSQVSFLV